MSKLKKIDMEKEFMRNGILLPDASKGTNSLKLEKGTAEYELYYNKRFEKYNVGVQSFNDEGFGWVKGRISL